ncbi:MAG: ISL3 family transposase [Campylobacterota bacterium]
MMLPKFIRNIIPNFEIIDMKEWNSKGFIEIFLEKKEDDGQNMLCCRCGTPLTISRGKHRMRLQHLPIFNLKVFIYLWREKRHCPCCKKARSEALDFIAEETPHLTKEYSWWLGRLCEISAVKNVSDLTSIDNMTLHRLDFGRLKRLVQRYKIPDVKRISVDEVYGRSKKYHAKESRDKQFFTVVCDLDSRRVVWVTESRDKKALDEFFLIIGKDRADKIEVVAMDQHDPYRASVKENCPNAEVVWDRFHLIQSFEKAMNEERRDLHANSPANSDIKYTACGTFKYLFLKRAKDRTKKEARHIEKVAKENKAFYYLELIKEKMLHIFNEKTEMDALWELTELEDWIKFCCFENLKKWFKHFMDNWDTIKNYFHHRVTSSLSEGQNNAIKALKRRGFGYRNMLYFKLKILQVCGFLNSKYVPQNEY